MILNITVSILASIAILTNIFFPVNTSSKIVTSKTH